MAENNRIFVDSNYWIALWSHDDTLYEKALLAAEGLDRDAARIVISNFIFLEVTTVLSQKKGRNVSIDAGKHLLTHPLIEIIHIDETLQKETWRIFQEMSSKNVGFVDCSILAVMQEEKIPELLTFDTSDFKKLAKQHSISLFSVK